MSDLQQFSAKAFINGELVQTSADSYKEAYRLYWLYRETPGCDAAYTYEGDRIRESWSESYDAYMESQEGAIEECLVCCGPLTNEDDCCPHCGSVR